MADVPRGASKGSRAQTPPVDQIVAFESPGRDDDDESNLEEPMSPLPMERLSAVRQVKLAIEEKDERRRTKEIPEEHVEACEETPVTRMASGVSFILPEEQAEGVRCHEFHEWLEEDRRQTLNCKTLPLTMVTWLAFLSVIWCHGNIDDTFRMRECLKGAVAEVKARHTVSTGQSIESHVSLSTVNSIDEMWSWIEGGLVPTFAGSPQKPGFVRTFNKVIGSIQLRETRFKAGECQVGTDLAEYFRQGCHSASEVSDSPYGRAANAPPDVATGPPGANATNAAENVTAPIDREDLYAFLPASIRFKSGEISETNAQRFFSWLDVQDPARGQALARSLRTNTWIDDGTKSLEVLIVLFNSEIQCYGHINVKLKLERGGLIKVDLEVRSLWATMYTEGYHILADIFWLLCVLKFLANSIQRAVDNRKVMRSCRMRCCALPKEAGGGFWLGLDWIGLALAFILMGFLLPLSAGYVALAEKVGNLMAPAPLTGMATYADVTDWETAYGKYHAGNAEIIEDIEWLMSVKTMHHLFMFWYAMVFLLRWFKGFRGQARIAQITSTISSAGADLAHFAIIFLVLFINFAVSGHVLFGHEVTEFSSPTEALQSAIGMAWGRVEFSGIYEIAPYSAVIWLFGYVLAMVMLSMNMVLAIIADHYGGVFHANNAGDKGYDLFGQIHALLNDIWWKLSYVLRTIYRIVYDKWLPYKMQQKSYIPRFPPEETRRSIPYENIYSHCESDPHGYVSQVLLRNAGCDKATAKHLLAKCEDEVLRHLPEFYPLPLLFQEFDESMEQYYDVLDHFSNELRTWFAEKSVASSKMIPRQTKLDAYSQAIEEAQHIEHKHHHHHRADHAEGEGVHHHHHRRHNEDNQSQGSYSQAASQFPSRQTSTQI